MEIIISCSKYVALQVRRNARILYIIPIKNLRNLFVILSYIEDERKVGYRIYGNE